MGTFDHIHIYATDVTATIEFYKTVLDAETIGSLTNASGGLNHLLILGGQYIAISAFPVGMAARNPTARLEGALDVGFGIVHFGFNVDDIDAFIERAQHHGCEIHGEPQSSGPLRYVYFTAPDGVVVELTQYVLPPKLQLAGAGMRSVNRIIHSVRRWIGRRMIAAAQQ